MIAGDAMVRADRSGAALRSIVQAEWCGDMASDSPLGECAGGFADRGPQALGVMLRAAAPGGSATMRDAAGATAPNSGSAGWQSLIGWGRASAAGGGAQALWLVFLMLVLTQVTTAFVALNPMALTVLLYARRLIWLVVTVACVVAALRGQAGRVFAPLIAFVPYFGVGLVSSLISVEPMPGLVELAYWLITMLGACVIGRQFRNADLPLAMMVWFATILMASIVVAVMLPRLGVDHDNRTAHGAWRGVFTGKNLLAWYAGFALLLAAFGSSVRIGVRIALAAIAATCLYFTHSAGGIATTLAVFSLLAMFAFWRRLGLSRGLQILANGLVLGFGALAGGLGYQLVLGALGRDGTLTGRTFLWQAYFARALESWVLGAGPGSFTNLSLTTQDIGLRYQSYGRIVTPHNMYLATFGEVGLIGLICFVLPLVYFAFVESVGSARPDRQLLAAFSLFFLISGLEETHEVFGIGSGLFLILLLRAWQLPDRAPALRSAGIPAAATAIDRQAAWTNSAAN